MADGGTVAVVSLIAPLTADREHLRDAHRAADLPFLEVFVDTPLIECEQRDPKGLYARARAGEIKDFTGIDSPYEAPEQPELRVDTTMTSVELAVEKIIELLRARPDILAKGATMRISAKGDYAVRAALELAAAPDGAAITAQEIASTQGMPVKFLERILAELRTAGLVRRAPGQRPGYALSAPASQLTIADVIRAVEGPLASVHGARPEDADYPGAARELPRVWIALRKNLREVVERVTLSDVAGASLPPDVIELSDDPEAWVTR
jgi:Rrf2 family protein